MPKLQLNGLDELRCDTYDNACIFKEKMKKAHNQHILHHTFNPFGKVLLYNSCLQLFPRKLCSCWTRPFILRKIYYYGAIDIENSKTGQVFK